MQISHQTYEELFEKVLPIFWQTPFYRDKLEQAGVSLRDLFSLKDIVKVPFTYKSEIRRSSPFYRTPLKPREIRFLFSSSGTTGKPTVYVWGDEDIRTFQEASKKAFTDIGVNASDTILVLAPFGMPVMGYCMLEQYRSVGATVIPLGILPPQEVLDALNKWPVTAVATLPSVAVKLHEFAVNNQIALPSRPISFHFGGYFMSNALRKRIENMWGGRAFNLFGMSEIFGPIGWESKPGEGFRYIVEYLYIEVLDPETLQPVPPGTPGVAVYTTLWHKGFPLLRYWSDDYIVMHIESDEGYAPRFSYLGRPNESIEINGKRFFALQIDEIIFSYPVGNEYKLEIRSEGSKDVATLMVEVSSPGASLIHSLSERLSSYLHIRVDIKPVPLGTINRNYIKPIHLIDQRR